MGGRDRREKGKAIHGLLVKSEFRELVLFCFWIGVLGGRGVGWAMRYRPFPKGIQPFLQTRRSLPSASQVFNDSRHIRVLRCEYRAFSTRARLEIEQKQLPVSIDQQLP